MVLLGIVGILAAIALGTFVVGLNDFCVKRYNYEPLGFLSTFWIGVASLIFLVGVLGLPPYFLVRQVPMTAAEISVARAELVSEQARAQEVAKTVRDPVDKADAIEDVKRLTAMKAPTQKDVYTFGNLTQFVQWPIPGSLKASLYCAVAALAILIGNFVNVALKTNWAIAVATLILQLAICATVIVFLALVYGWTAYKRNKAVGTAGRLTPQRRRRGI